MNLRSFLLSTFALCAAVRSPAAATDPEWPQFRGPNGSGVAAKAHPPFRISPTNGLLWKIDVPWSPSSPAISGDRIFLTTLSNGELQTRCYARADGRLLWVNGVKPEQLEVFHGSEGSPAASTPATDGQRVVSYFGSFGLICYTINGKEIWRRPLPVARSGGGFGTGTSPIVVMNTVILNRDQDQGSSLMAFSLADGKPVWETARPDASGSFGTPIFWMNRSNPEIVAPGSIHLRGYDARTGAERWVYEGVSAFACTTPVVGGDLLFFAAWSPGKSDAPFPPWTVFLQRYDKNGDGVIELQEFPPEERDFLRGMDFDRDGKVSKEDFERLASHNAKGENVLVAIKAGGRGDITKTHGAWRFTRGLPYVPSPLYYGGRLYVIRDGMVSSFDAASGKTFYVQERIGANGSYYASPVAAENRIYFVSLPGKLTVIEAGGDQPKVLHQAEFGERVFATPAFAGENIYLRTESKLYGWQ